MLETKDIIFFVGTAVCVPAGIVAAVYSRRALDFVFIFLVFGTAQPDSLFGLPTDINFLSREWYRGSTRGIEISYLDLLAVILLVSSFCVRFRESKRPYWPASLGPLVAYLLWCVLTVSMISHPKIFGVYEVTKIIRSIVLFVSTAWYVRGMRELRIFLAALALTFGYEASVCAYDRYVLGVNRIRGTLNHPNSLSMYCLQYLPIAALTTFAPDAGKLRWPAIATLLGTCAMIILSISRTGFISMLVILAISLLIALWPRLTRQKLIAAGLVTLFVAVGVAKGWDSVQTRLQGTNLENEYFTQEGDRGSYFRKAAPAIHDHPLFGVGLNNWSYWISNVYGAMAGYEVTPYPSIDEMPTIGYPEAPAHNLYLITVTELGWPGLFILMLVFFRWLVMNAHSFLSRSESLFVRTKQGITISVLGIMLQSWTEWEFRQTSLYFLGHILVAAGAALSRQRSVDS